MGACKIYSSLEIIWKFVIEVLVAVVIWLAVNIPFDSLMELAPKRQFFLDDQSISYSYVENEKVGLWLLDGINLGIVLILILIEGLSAGWRQCLVLFGVILIANSPLQAISNLLKIFVARLRPDFLDRCQPDPVTLECTSDDESRIRNGRTSFPSGHCVSIWYYCGVACLYLTFRLFGGEHSKDLYSLRVLAVLAPTIIAFYVSAERNTDHRHHPTDILAGSLLGLAAVGLWGVLVINYYTKFGLGRPGTNTHRLGKGKKDDFLKTLLENDVSVDVENSCVVAKAPSPDS